MSERIIWFPEEEQTVDAESWEHTVQEIHALERYFCFQNEALVEQMRDNISKLSKMVKHCSMELEAFSEQDKRYHAVCRMLEQFEQVKLEWDKKMLEYYQLEYSLLDFKRCFAVLEGSCFFRNGKSAEQDDFSDVLQTELYQKRKNILESEERYRFRRQAFDDFSQHTIAHFLEVVYRLSNAEHDGKGLRAGALNSLLGEFCYVAERMMQER